MKAFLIVILAFFVTLRDSDGADMMSLTDSISIKSVNALRVTDSPPVLKALLTLQNESDRTISIKNGQFRVIINPDSRYSLPLPEKLKEMVAELGGTNDIIPDTKLDLGKTLPLNFNIQAGEFERGVCKKPGESSLKIEIPLPDYTEEREHIIYKLLNYIAFPGSYKKICLIGTAEVGITGKEGGKHSRFNVELYYNPPKIQSEVLFFGW